MARDLPTYPELTGHIDGFALRWGNEEVAVFPSFVGAVRGLEASREALGMLAACLAMNPDRREM